MGHTLQTLRVLLWARWRQIINAYWRSGTRRRIMLVGVILLMLLGIAMAAGFSALVIGGLRSVKDETFIAEFNPATILGQIPHTILFAILMVSLLTSIGSTLNSLFFSPALDRLLLAPIPMRAVVMATLFSVAINSWVLLIFIAIVPLTVYGISAGAGVAYFVSMPLLVLSMPLLPTTLGALLAIGIVRVIPARRLREILSVFTGVIGIFCYAGSQLLGRSDILDKPENATWLAALDQPWLPSSWAGDALNLLAEGNLRGLLLVLGILAGSVVSFAGVSILTERLFLVGWQNIASGSSRSKRPIEALWAGWQGQIRSIFNKDVRLIRRDLRQLSQFLWMFVFLGFYMWQLQDDARDNVLRALPALGIVLVICSSVSTGLAISSISREGRTYWLLHTAPIAPARIVMAKWLMAWLVFPILSAIVLGVIAALGLIAPALALAGWILICLIGSAVSAISTGVGAAFPKLDWDKPEQMQQGRGGCLGMLIQWTCMLVIGGAYSIAMAPTLFAMAGGDAITIPLLIRMIAGSTAVILNIVVCWLSITFASSRLGALEL